MLANEVDLDFTGTICPPPDAAVPALTDAERLTIARWIDLGAPVRPQAPDERAPYGWFLDELRPTLTVSQPCRDRSTERLDRLVVGAYDYYSGLDRESLSVTADFEVNGLAPGSELAGHFGEQDFVWSLPLQTPIEELETGVLTVRVRDEQGNWASVVSRFGVR